MPIVFITVKLPDGGVFHLDVDTKERVEVFKGVIASKTRIPKNKQKLVLAGRLLQDGRTLEAYGIEGNSTIHLMTGPSNDGKVGDCPDISTIPSQLGALQRHVLQNPDIMQQMLESPAMMSLVNDYDFLRSLLTMSPHLKDLQEGNPDFKAMLADEEFMTQACESLRNPVHVRDVLRSTDRSMSTLEDIEGGGFDLLRQMCAELDPPPQDEREALAAAKTRLQGDMKRMAWPKSPGTSHAGAGGDQPDDEPTDGDLSPQASSANGPAGGLSVPAVPGWVGSFDTNSMAAMLQDHNMQTLLAQLVQAMPGPGSVGGMGSQKPADDPFSDPVFLGLMFQSQTMQAMSSMQDSVASMSMSDPTPPPEGDKKTKDAREKRKSQAPKKGEGEGVEVKQDSPAALSGLNPQSPAANFSTSFELFLKAEGENPEVRFKGQLAAMGNMGFTEKEECISALSTHGGNMNKAVEMLMAAQQPS